LLLKADTAQQKRYTNRLLDSISITRLGENYHVYE
jgi:hypothetical protein